MYVKKKIIKIQTQFSLLRAELALEFYFERFDYVWHEYQIIVVYIHLLRAIKIKEKKRKKGR